MIKEKYLRQLSCLLFMRKMYSFSMKKVMKDQLQKISSRVGIIIFCVLIILIVQTSIKNIGIREIEYGPYTCDTNTLKIHIKEHKNRLE